jgi:hypothetical protein
VIGGFKSDGTATATSLPTLSPWLIGGVILIGAVALLAWRRSK